ncbi:hypothetical protein EV363DRAFT_1359180, partial [Boletus edulis]
LPPDDSADPFNQASSQAHVPLGRKPIRSDDFDNRSRLNNIQSRRHQLQLRFRVIRTFQEYVPKSHKEGLIAKEAMAGEIMENETTEVVKETSARRCWWFGQMKRQDVRQAWREKFALNIIIWFVHCS